MGGGGAEHSGAPRHVPNGQSGTSYVFSIPLSKHDLLICNSYQLHTLSLIVLRQHTFAYMQSRYCGDCCDRKSLVFAIKYCVT